MNLLKIIVTDNSGDLHEFASDGDEIEVYFEPVCHLGVNWIKIITRVFEGGAKKYTHQDESLFQNARRVDLVYAS